LHNFVQGNKSVREYVADLDKLFTIVGADSKHARVVKLFNGFCAPLCKALLHEHLNPEHTSWKAMVHEAEYQEMAENVDVCDVQTSNNQSGAPQGQYNPERNDNNSHRGKNPSSARSKHYQSGIGRKTNTTTGGASNNHYGGATTQNTKGNSSFNKKPNANQQRPLSKEEREELKAAGKCFICKKDGHFSRNCPDKSRQTSSGHRPPGISANSIRFHESVDFEQTEQLRINSLGETTTSLSIGTIKIGKVCEYMDDVLWGCVSEKEYDSDGDTIPDLQLVSDTDSELERNKAAASDDEVAQMLNDLSINDEPEEVEDGEEKIFLIEMEEGTRRHLGHAVARKAEDLLESMQPYPGNPANVLQLRGCRFVAYLVDEADILIRDRVADTFVSIERKQIKKVHFSVGEWYVDLRSNRTGVPVTNQSLYQTCLIVNPDCWNTGRVLASGVPYPWDDEQGDSRLHRFEIEAFHLKNTKFDLVSWYRKEVRARFEDVSDTNSQANTDGSTNKPLGLEYLFDPEDRSELVYENPGNQYPRAVELFGQQVPTGTYPAIQRNATHAKDPSRKVPKPLVIVVKVNGEPA
ncbi:hypothetical protein C0992_003339, partial [Termitomyces sp. T32_za158]